MADPEEPFATPYRVVICVAPVFSAREGWLLIRGPPWRRAQRFVQIRGLTLPGSDTATEIINQASHQICGASIEFSGIQTGGPRTFTEVEIVVLA